MEIKIIKHMNIYKKLRKLFILCFGRKTLYEDTLQKLST